MKRILIFLCLYAATTLVHASSCAGDMDEMRFQISQNGRIDSIDGKYFNSIGPFTGESDGNCGSYAFYYPGGRQDPKHACIVIWAKGNWGKTLYCAQGQ